ncbi:MAG TPA: 2-oxoacid:acceptor oxidoreductase subunit alpha [Patescibacteria group bacterium]|nr:2-oxoacid:acceptor oxidoreductase subunit alpha [Patescibacteria group bacterium]
MIYNLLIGGAAGLGMETLALILEKILKRKGFEIFVVHDYMSRVRGGHNFFQIRFANEKIDSHGDELAGILALDRVTIQTHVSRLKPDGFIFADEEVEFQDDRMYRLALKSTAKTIGNPKIFGSVALGAVLRLFNLDFSSTEDVINEKFAGETARQNMSALEAGYRLVTGKYEIAANKKDGQILINTTEAIALGALASGLKFYSAYPMAPSTGIMNFLASKMNEAEIIVEQAEDEIAAINMAIGASYAGVRAMTGTSGGGLALMVEAVGLAAMAEIPLVIVNVQRPGPATGLPTRTEQGDLKFAIFSSPAEIPKMVIALRDPEDAFYQTNRAFRLADKYQIPVVLLSDQFLADSTRTVNDFDFSRINNDRYLSCETYSEAEYRRYEITATGISPRIIPGQFPGTRVLIDSDEHDEYGRITESATVRNAMQEKRLRKMSYLREDIQEPIYAGEDQADTLLLAWGSLSSPVKEALRLLNASGGNKYGALLFGDVWPLPDQLLKEKSQSARRIINVEQNATGLFASLVQECTGIKCAGSILKYDGRPLSAQEIFAGVNGGESA